MSTSSRDTPLSLLSGAQGRFVEVPGELVTEEQLSRVGAALAALR